MIMTDKGLDLNFCETKKSLNIPTKCGKYRFSQDPMFERLGESLSQIDYKQYLTRFNWKNLPSGMDSELIERVLYYNGSGMFFYIKELDKFFFLPYGMTGEGTATSIDFYGRFMKIKPFSFNGTTDTKGQSKSNGQKSTADLFLSTQIRDNIIDIPMVESEEQARKIFEEGAVICWDHTPGLAYYVNSRNREAKPYLEYMIKVLIQTKSALINASGFNMFATATENAVEIMQMQLDQISTDREMGKLSAAVSNDLGEIENLQSNTPSGIQDFWASLQSVDNLRLKSLGISNDGLQQKSQYQNINEQSMDIDSSMQVYLNAFTERVKFAAAVNSIWGLDIYPEPVLMPQEGQENGQEEDNSNQEQAQEGQEGGNDGN